MPKKEFFESSSPDNFDFILNSLKRNSEDLNTLLNEVRTIADRMGDICELTTFKRFEEKINSMQNDIRNLAKASSTTLQETQSSQSNADLNKLPRNSPEILEERSMPVILRFKKWDEFQAFASQPKTVSFTYRESDKAFEVDAVKNNQLMAYVGEIPDLSSLLKAFLSRQLALSGEKMFEGTLTTP